MRDEGRVGLETPPNTVLAAGENERKGWIEEGRQLSTRKVWMVALTDAWAADT